MPILRGRLVVRQNDVVPSDAQIAGCLCSPGYELLMDASGLYGDFVDVGIMRMIGGSGSVEHACSFDARAARRSLRPGARL